MQQEYFKQIEELYKKFKKQAKIKDLKYICQISKSQDDKEIVYAVQFTNIATSIAPVTFLGKTPEEVINKVSDFVKDKDYDFVEIKYHEAQAYHANETAKLHLDMIEKIKQRNSESK
jgi:rubrerythrin